MFLMYCISFGSSCFCLFEPSSTANRLKHKLRTKNSPFKLRKVCKSVPGCLAIALSGGSNSYCCMWRHKCSAAACRAEADPATNLRGRLIILSRLYHMPYSLLPPGQTLIQLIAAVLDSCPSFLAVVSCSKQKSLVGR